MKIPGILLLLILLDGVAMITHWNHAQQIEENQTDRLSAELALGVVFFGSFGSETRERVRRGVDLHLKGTIDALLFVGGSRGNAQQGEKWIVDQARDIAGEDALHIGKGSMDTSGNLIAICHWLTEHPEYRAIYLVSDPLHLLRIRWMSSRLPCTASLALTLVPSDYYPDPLERVARIHADWLSRIAFLLLDLERYQSLIARFRY